MKVGRDHDLWIVNVEIWGRYKRSLSSDFLFYLSILRLLNKYIGVIFVHLYVCKFIYLCDDNLSTGYQNFIKFWKQASNWSHTNVKVRT